IRNLSVSRSEDGISEFMETIPHSVVFRMPSLSRICRGKVRQSRKAEKGCLKEVSMLFMVSSRPKAGATREQLIEHLARRLVLLRGIWPAGRAIPGFIQGRS